MTKKQMRKTAKEIISLEKIHRNPESSQDEISKAEKRIIQISNMLSCLPDGMDIMMEIDAMVQEELSKEN